MSDYRKNASFSNDQTPLLLSRTSVLITHSPFERKTGRKGRNRQTDREREKKQTEKERLLQLLLVNSEKQQQHRGHYNAVISSTAVNPALV